MEKTTTYSEVKIDYIDNNGVAHIDSYSTDDPDCEGAVLGYIVNDEVYWKVFDAQFDQQVKDAVKEYLADKKDAHDKLSLADQVGVLKGDELMGAFTDMVNYRGKEDVTKFLEQFKKEHNTLQQSVFRVMMETIDLMASEDIYVDGRNESSQAVAKAILRGFREEMRLKFIAEGCSEERALEYSKMDMTRPSQYLPTI